MRAAARVRMRGRTAAAALDGGCGADGMEQHHGDGQRSPGNSSSSLLPSSAGGVNVDVVVKAGSVWSTLSRGKCVELGQDAWWLWL
jgi:hypothetical protein